jgi:hypothetical protein
MLLPCRSQSARRGGIAERDREARGRSVHGAGPGEPPGPTLYGNPLVGPCLPACRGGIAERDREVHGMRENRFSQGGFAERMASRSRATALGRARRWEERTTKYTNYTKQIAPSDSLW